MKKKHAVILGAGPAGLTAAYELLTRTDYIPIVIEMSNDVGGLSRTVNVEGNYLDIGGHRFFTKNERVLQWWLKFLPLQSTNIDCCDSITMQYKGQTTNLNINRGDVDPDILDEVMLRRERVSRIYHAGKFFNYPVKINFNTLRRLGLVKSFRILFTYFMAKIVPREEKSLEDFYINRFGKELYRTFFKSYTEKVCGKECSEIDPEWGRLRIKNISLLKIIGNYLDRSLNKTGNEPVVTSLIEYFLYPKYGPGQLWRLVANQVVEMGGIIQFGMQAVKIETEEQKVVRIIAREIESGNDISFSGDIFISTIAMKQLFEGIQPQAPRWILDIARGLEYRDFISVGILLPKYVTDGELTVLGGLRDNWIYIQDSRVELGRVQIVNNWSPYMVSDPEKYVWLCLEYFSSSSDRLWLLSDDEIIDKAVDELKTIGLINAERVVQSKLIRVEKAYPSYSGTYKDLDSLIQYVNTISNLFLIGRNGMHFYNSQDHSILTAMAVVDDLISANTDKKHIWEIRLES